MKQKIEFKDNVSETLLIPLWMRATDPVLHDARSMEIVRQIDYDFEKFSIDKNSQTGVRLRTLYLRDVMQDFIDSHERAVIVMLGCGLDPQAQRVSSRPGTQFYAIDLPDVIALRRRFLPDSDHEHSKAASALDTMWMDELRSKHAHSPFLFVAEGLLMYFTVEQNRRLLCDLAARFPRAEIYLERISRMAVRMQNKHKSVSQTTARFSWGVDDPSTVCAWHKGVQFIARYDYMIHAPGFFGLVARLVPPIGRSFGIWGFRLQSK